MTETDIQIDRHRQIDVSTDKTKIKYMTQRQTDR